MVAERCRIRVRIIVMSKVPIVKLVGLFAIWLSFLTVQKTASADTRPCKLDEYYVSLGENLFCIPSRFRKEIRYFNIVPEDPMAGIDPGYQALLTNKLPVEISFVYFDFERRGDAEKANLKGLSGTRFSIEPDKGNTYVEYLKQMALVDVYGGWRFEGRHAGGRLVEYSRRLGTRIDPVENLYFVTEKDAAPESATYAFLCGPDVRPKEVQLPSPLIIRIAGQLVFLSQMVWLRTCGSKLEMLTLKLGSNGRVAFNHSWILLWSSNN